MKTFIPALSYSLLILAFYVVLAATPYTQYGENYISFIGILLLVGAVCAIIINDRIITKAIKNPDYKVSGKLRSSILTLIRITAAVISAGLGWYFVASGFLLYSLVCLVQDDAIRKGKANG